MNNLMQFQFNGHSVRIQDHHGNPWFVAKDVCACLKLSNVSKAVERLYDNEKNSITLSDGIPGRGNPNVLIINESGFYKLVMRSRSAEARAFQDWVTQDVLPSIRKTGGYAPAQAETTVELNFRNDEKVRVSFDKYSSMMNAMIEQQGKIIQLMEEKEHRRQVQLYVDTVRLLILETNLDDHEIARRMRGMIGDFMPEWVSWQRRRLSGAYAQ